jgi:hypothetical protein
VILRFQSNKDDNVMTAVIMIDVVDDKNTEDAVEMTVTTIGDGVATEEVATAAVPEVIEVATGAEMIGNVQNVAITTSRGEILAIDALQNDRRMLEAPVAEATTVEIVEVIVTTEVAEATTAEIVEVIVTTEVVTEVEIVEDTKGIEVATEVGVATTAEIVGIIVTIEVATEVDAATTVEIVEIIVAIEVATGVDAATTVETEEVTVAETEEATVAVTEVAIVTVIVATEEEHVTGVDEILGQRRAIIERSKSRIIHSERREMIDSQRVRPHSEQYFSPRLSSLFIEYFLHSGHGGNPVFVFFTLRNLRGIGNLGHPFFGLRTFGITSPIPCRFVILHQWFQWGGPVTSSSVDFC